MPESTYPSRPAFAAGFGQAAWLSADGEVELRDGAKAAARARGKLAMVCHAPATARRLYNARCGETTRTR